MFRASSLGDTRYGDRFDVLREGNCLCQLIQAGRLVCLHLALPCQSSSFARLPQLRSWKHKFGVPGMNARQERLVKAGNSLMIWTVAISTLAWQCGAFFSIENPMPSWAWSMPQMLSLWARAGVIMVILTYDSYGMPWRKLTGVITNLTSCHGIFVFVIAF